MTYVYTLPTGTELGTNVDTQNLYIDGVLTIDSNRNLYVQGVTSSGSTTYADDVTLSFGDSNDLQIFHQSSNGNSIIKDTGPGDLSIQSDGSNINFWDITNQEHMLIANIGGSVTLYHAGDQKLTTRTDGVGITGDAFFDNGSGIQSAAGARIKTGSGGGSWSIIPDATNAVALFVQDSSNNEIIRVDSEDNSNVSHFYYDVDIQADLTVTGDLTVSGTTTYLNTTNLEVSDAVIKLNSGQATPSNDIGLVFQRYSSPTSTNYNVSIAWEEGTDRLIFGKTPEDASDNDVSFSAEWMTIANNGHVGIGVADPSEGHLQVWGGDSQGFFIGNNNTSNYTHNVIQASDDQLSSGLDIVRRSNIVTRSAFTRFTAGGVVTKSTDFKFYDTDGTNYTEHMRIEGSTGHVGIGTNNPSELLHVAGSTAPTIKLEATGASGWSGADMKIQFAASSGLGGFIGSNAGESKFIMGTNSSYSAPLVFQTQEIDRITILDNGNVGIGNTNPDKLFVVHGADAEIAINDTNSTPQVRFRENGVTKGVIQTTSGDMLFYTDGSLAANESMRITAGGDVGIGTASPAANLHIADAGDPTITLEDTNAANQMKIHYLASGVSWVSGLHGGENAFKISESAGFGTSDYFTVKGTSGSVGIGTVLPERNLHVYNTGATVATKIEAGDTSQASVDLKNTQGEHRIIAEAGEFKIYDQGDSAYRMVIDTSGFVGIGTTSNLANPLTVYHPTINNTLKLQSGDANVWVQFADNATTATQEPQVGAIGDNLVLRTAASSRITVLSTGQVGIATDNPDNLLHVFEADSGGAPNSNAQIVVEDADTAGVAIQTGNTGSGYVWFGDASDNAIARIRYDHATDKFTWRVAGVDDVLTLGSQKLTIDHTLEITTGTDESYTFLPGKRAINYDQAGSAVDGPADLPLAWIGNEYLAGTQTYATASFSQTFTIGTVGGTRWFAKVKTNDAQDANGTTLSVNDGVKYSLDYSDANPNGVDESDLWHVFDVTDDIVQGTNTIKVYLTAGQKTTVHALYIFPSTGIALPNEPGETVQYSYDGYGVGDSVIINKSGEITTTKINSDEYHLPTTSVYMSDDYSDGGSNITNDDAWVYNASDGRKIFAVNNPVNGNQVGLTYGPQESGTYTSRYFMLFDTTNDASKPQLTNRTPAGPVEIWSGTTAGGGEIKRLTVQGGDNRQNIDINNADLQIFGSHSQDVILRMDAQTADKTDWRIRVTEDTVADGKFIIEDFSSGGWTSNLTVANEGFVGIGVTDPDARLEIANGSATMPALHIKGENGSATANNGIGVGPWILLDNTANAGSTGYPKTAGILYQASNADNSWEFNSSQDYAYVMFSRTNSPANNASQIEFGTQSGTGAASTRMTVDPSGNVGVGITNPTAKLQVDGGTGLASISTQNPDFMIGLYTGQNLSMDSNEIQSRNNGVADDLLLQKNGGNVGINTSAPGYTLEVVGSFAATTKSFVIDHPTKEGMKLRHGSLEGPEDGVYVRGKLDGNNVIELPDYWTGLVHEDSITVQLTAIGVQQDLWIEDIKDNRVYIGSESRPIKCFYYVQAERKDVDRWDVEFDA